MGVVLLLNHQYSQDQFIITTMKSELPPAYVITEEQPEDVKGVRQVNLAAFNGGGEAAVVEQLRETCPTYISLVAKMDQEVVGHILFTPVRIIQNEGWSVAGVGLAPLAVLPAYQRQGIGAALCIAGVDLIESAGYPFIVVLGHPYYYPRFGFEQASTYGISCAYEGVPNEAFMIRMIDAVTMKGVSGVAYYRQEFDSVT